MQSVATLMAFHLARVVIHTLEGHRIVGQNAQLILNVRVIRHVFVKNVLIRAPDHVVCRPHVRF